MANKNSFSKREMKLQLKNISNKKFLSKIKIIQIFSTIDRKGCKIQKSSSIDNHSFEQKALIDGRELYTIEAKKKENQIQLEFDFFCSFSNNEDANSTIIFFAQEIRKKLNSLK